MRYLSILFVIITSCQSIKTINNTKRCINRYLSKNSSKYYGVKNVDFYDLMKDIENKMIKDGILQNKTKNDYFKLTEQLFENGKSKKYDSLFNKYIIYLEKKGLEIYVYSNRSAILVECPMKNYANGDKTYKKILTNQMKLNDSIEAYGFSKKLLLKFIDTPPKKEFNKIIYRAPIIFQILSYFEFKKYKNIKQ